MWFDLFTTDTEAAKNFYAKVAGWKAVPFGELDPGYQMFMSGDVPVGGVSTLKKEKVSQSIPAHWLGFVAVEDVNKTATRAKEMGGTIAKEPWDIASVGRIAVILDPQGGALGIFTPEKEGESIDASSPLGRFAWSELAAEDGEWAYNYYRDLLGWLDSDVMEMGPAGTYRMFKVEGMEKAAGGIYSKSKELPHTAWLYYITVAELDASVKTVKSEGGKVLNGPMDVPGGGRICQCLDPQGVAFALFQAASAE